MKTCPLSSSNAFCISLCIHVEDAKLFKHDFRKLWAAEGFITQQGNSTLEDIAEDCYNELKGRCLLQLHPINLDGNICILHDLTRSLALFLTRGESHIVDGHDSTIANSLKFPVPERTSSQVLSASNLTYERNRNYPKSS